MKQLSSYPDKADYLRDENEHLRSDRGKKKYSRLKGI